MSVVKPVQFVTKPGGGAVPVGRFLKAAKEHLAQQSGQQVMILPNHVRWNSAPRSGRKKYYVAKLTYPAKARPWSNWEEFYLVGNHSNGYRLIDNKAQQVPIPLT